MCYWKIKNINNKKYKQKRNFVWKFKGHGHKIGHRAVRNKKSYATIWHHVPPLHLISLLPPPTHKTSTLMGKIRRGQQKKDVSKACFTLWQEKITTTRDTFFVFSSFLPLPQNRKTNAHKKKEKLFLFQFFVFFGHCESKSKNKRTSQIKTLNHQ